MRRRVDAYTGRGKNARDAAPRDVEARPRSDRPAPRDHGAPVGVSPRNDDLAWTVDRTQTARQVPLSQVERAVLLTVLYADLFDFPLTRRELFQRLVATHSAEAHVDAAARRLSATCLSVVDEFVVWQRREHLVDIRRRRKKAAPILWEAARRYGDWLAHVPFVRMVAVSGSLAVENADSGSDIDLFCVTDARRLWLARLLIVPLSKLTRRFPPYLCPNYILAADALEIDDRNLFTAHEVAQAVPIWGADVFRRFLDANRWVRTFLPHFDPDVPAIPARGPSGATRAVEWMLRGRLGDGLNRAAHRLFLAFYRRRAERCGWTWTSLAPAYRIDRYTVPEGGYVGVVRGLFADLVEERIGGASSAVSTLFPRKKAASCYDWLGLFRAEYGRPDADAVSDTLYSEAAP